VPQLSAASLMDLEAIGLDGDLPGSVLKDLLDPLFPLLAAAVPEACRLSSLVRGLVGREAVSLEALVLPLHFPIRCIFLNAVNRSPDDHQLHRNVN
jgi:hypothetical protein